MVSFYLIFVVNLGIAFNTYKIIFFVSKSPNFRLIKERK